MNRSEILDWYDKKHKAEKANPDCQCWECMKAAENRNDLDSMLRELIEGVPCKAMPDDNMMKHAYNIHCEEVAKYKEEVLK